MWKRMLLKLIIKIIRKYFPEGISVIVDNEENIIAYRWAWSKEVNDNTR